MPEPISALSLWQPWATLWAHGVKKIETRDWKLYGRIPRVFAVHATKVFDEDCHRLCQHEPFASALQAIGCASAAELPTGCVLGLVTIVRQYQFDGKSPPEPERSFGDYTRGRWGFVAENFRPLAKPIPARGGQKVWGWTPPPVLTFADGTTAVQPTLACVDEAAIAGKR